MKEITREKLFETLKSQVSKINYTMRVSSSLNRNEIAKLNAQKQILFTLAEKLDFNESELSNIIFA